MTFYDALLKMMGSYRVNRKGQTGFYYCILPNQDYIWKIFDHYNPPQVVTACFSVADLAAVDWEILK